MLKNPLIGLRNLFLALVLIPICIFCGALSPMSKEYLRISVNVPVEHADQVRKAMGEAGAGVLGNYGFCSFSHRGTGRFIPFEGANPAIGSIGQAELVEEEKLETFCEKQVLQTVIAAIKKAHPYEEPGIIVSPIEIY